MAKLLTLCPYPLLPLRGGGALRSFHLLRQLARFHEVHAIVFQREAELRRPTDGYTLPGTIRLYSPIDLPPPPGLFDLLPGRFARALNYRWLRRTFRGPAEGELLLSHHLVSRVLATQRIDVVIFEHRGTMKASPLVRRLSPATRLILDAHNVDRLLLAQEFSRNGTRISTARERAILARTSSEESKLDHYVDAIWCCSEEDRKSFTASNKIPVNVIPNGVDCSFFEFDSRAEKAKSPFVLFSGAMSTEANQNAVQWLLQEIWPRLQQIRHGLRLLLLGKGMPDHLVSAAASSVDVEVIGEVRDVRPFFCKASLTLVPLRIGSGTRLKILEAMAQGNPVVSTRKGAEGLNITDGENIVLAEDPVSFAQAADRLLANEVFFDRLRRNARAFVEKHYDWNLVGDMANLALQQAIRNPTSEP